MESYLSAEISASAVRKNIQLLRSTLSSDTKLCAVVKSDCYGHNVKILLPVIAPLADHLAVAVPEEAIEIRQLGCRLPVLVLLSSCCFCADSKLDVCLEELIQQDISLTLTTPAEIALIAAAARRQGKRPKVHIKTDSGMGRSGIACHDLLPLMKQVRGEPSLQLAGVFTHLATADDADKTYANTQLQRLVSSLDSQTRQGLIVHAANSAGTIDLPHAHLDMVRPGIALYGYQPSDDMQRKLPLQPAMRVWGRLMQVKVLPAGSRCGYGLTYCFDRESRTGLVPIGYGDGYDRSLSNRAVMKVRGRYAPVRGRVSMDQVIVDLTDVPQASVGDEVEIISNDSAAPNSVENLARMLKTIPYEITCRLGRRVRRVLVD